MAEALTTRGLAVMQVEQLPEVPPTVDPELGALIHTELEAHGVDVRCGTRIEAISRAAAGSSHQLAVETSGGDEDVQSLEADVVLVVVGVTPDSALAAAAGAQLGAKGAIDVDPHLRTNLPNVFAAGDCAVTHHRLLGTTYLPLGTTTHKQGRTAAENALGFEREFAGSLGTQVVKIFNLVAARTGLRDHEALAAGYQPRTVASSADDRKAYYPGSHPFAMRYTGDAVTGRLLGLQLVGRLGSEIAKRADIAAAAIFHAMTVDAISDLDLAYTPPLGSPWDAVQAGGQAWVRQAGPAAHGEPRPHFAAFRSRAR